MPVLKDLKIKTLSATEQVVRKFRELLLSGNLTPGDKLPTEPELAKMFGVGRSTIREALSVLTYLGIFETLVAKGTYVKASNEIYKEAIAWSVLLQPKDMEYLLDYREAIEAHSIRHVVNNHKSKPDQIEELIDRLSQLCDDRKDAFRRWFHQSRRRRTSPLLRGDQKRRSHRRPECRVRSHAKGPRVGSAHVRAEPNLIVETVCKSHEPWINRRRIDWAV